MASSSLSGATATCNRCTVMASETLNGSGRPTGSSCYLLPLVSGVVVSAFSVRRDHRRRGADVAFTPPRCPGIIHSGFLQSHRQHEGFLSKSNSSPHLALNCSISNTVMNARSQRLQQHRFPELTESWCGATASRGFSVSLRLSPMEERRGGGTLEKNATVRVVRAERLGSADQAGQVAGQEPSEDLALPARHSKVAVFVSGGGSNFRALHTAVLSGSIAGAIVAVVSDKPGCRGCDYAREHGIPVLAFPAGKNAPEGLSTDALVDALRSHDVDYVVLAGYLRLLPAELVRAFPRAILNIHPALLPSFGGRGYYGMKVHEAVVRSGARYTGATVHFVDEKYDTGPIVAQRTVPVLPTDSPQDVAARVLSQEHAVYPEVVAALCDGRIEWREDGVPMIRTTTGEYH